MTTEHETINIEVTADDCGTYVGSHVPDNAFLPAMLTIESYSYCAGEKWKIQEVLRNTFIF